VFDPPDCRLNAEQEREAVQEIDRIKAAVLKLFDDDLVAQTLAEGMMEGMEGEELRATTDLSRTGFASKRRLVRRQIDLGPVVAPVLERKLGDHRAREAHAGGALQLLDPVLDVVQVDHRDARARPRPLSWLTSLAFGYRVVRQLAISASGACPDERPIKYVIEINSVTGGNPCQ
jgi:hypothetical protein